jgi:hypothetical protein
MKPITSTKTEGDDGLPSLTARSGKLMKFQEDQRICLIQYSN